jgi:hypothetical protein
LQQELFEAWYDETDHSVELTSSSEIIRLKALGRWLRAPVFLHRFQAASLETAVELHEQLMDWDNSHAQADLIEGCPMCEVRYFSRRSTSCPNCGSNPESRPA